MPLDTDLRANDLTIPVHNLLSCMIDVKLIEEIIKESVFEQKEATVVRNHILLWKYCWPSHASNMTDDVLNKVILYLL